MLSVLQNKSLSLLETIVSRLDQYEEIQKRPRVFAKKDEMKEEFKEKTHDHNQDQDDDANDQSAQKEKFINLGCELIDIGLHTGFKGLEIIQSTKPYQVTDQYIHYDEKVKLAKDSSVKLYRFLNDKLYNPLKNNLYVIYDQSSTVISFFIKVLQEHQHKVVDYISHHYENVQVFIKDNWMRLDFNNDGQVDMEDLKRGFQDLYEFMVNFEYVQKATEIKSVLYEEAIRYMKKDLQNEEQTRESHIDENDSKIDNQINAID